MKSHNQLLFVLLIIWMAATTRAHAQNNEIENLFHDLEAMDAGTQAPFDKADPILKRLVQSSRENVAAALPLILHATSDPHLSVRRVAADALYQIITTRPDGQALLSPETSTFAALLVDPDIPIRRITGMAIQGLHPDASSPLLPVLEAYLAREDAVSTIGAGVAGVLMQAAPSKADSTSAIVQFMRRQDQTSKSRNDILQSIQVARPDNRDIGKEVAAYAGDPDDQTSIHAIETLQWMGKNVVLDNQASLLRVAADNRRAPGVRAAATKALSAVP